jgi:L-rhamnose isomerase
MNPGEIESGYASARDRYASDLGVNTDAALAALARVPLSVHCWQGDDVTGFESLDAGMAGAGLSASGLAVTGNYPGKARNPEELRKDMDAAFSLIPGPHRANVHAMYAEFGGNKVDRDVIGPGHFAGWLDWARKRGVGLDFNASCFSHPKAADGFTLASRDPGIRKFWIAHVARCREISAGFGRELGTPCVHNLWIPDGCKDATVSRLEYRELLRKSLDEIFAVRQDPAAMKDAVEGKLFGIGSESFVAGSQDFYLAYAVKSGVMPCLDLGHYHPTELVADKISAILLFCPEVLVHVSRGVRWDSDHVPVVNDELTALMSEIVRARALDRVHLALDYFDASINRIGAWVTGARATMKALLLALLEPGQRLLEAERAGDGFGRLALLEEAKAMPLGAVWDYHCLKSGVPSGTGWVDAIKEYEKAVLSGRKG